MIITYKYRLKDRRAAKYLRDHARACNQVWNWAVAQHRHAIRLYQAGGSGSKWPSHFDLAKACKGIGKELGINQQTVACVCEQWVRHRSVRFRPSYGAKRALGWVPFQKQSRQISGNTISYLGRQFRFFGEKNRPVPTTAKGGYFVEDALGRWWVCLHVKIEPAASSRKCTGAVGIDLGLREFATLSDGTRVRPLRASRLIHAKIANAQRARRFARVRALHAKAANMRRDFHHKLSTRICQRHALVAVGAINASTLARTRLGKSVLDAGWTSFRRMLRYKAQQLVEVDERFTTQTCSACGALPPGRPRGIAGLGIREWECCLCGTIHDRDVNAAKNILVLALSVERPGEGSRKGGQ